MSKVLITGASGLVGKTIAKCLADDGYYVTGITRDIKKTGISNSSGIREWMEIDLNKNLNELPRILKKTDYVVHAAGMTPRKSNIPYKSYINFNYEITRQLAQMASETGTVKRFIYISTIKVHGEKTKKGDDAISELSEIMPQDHYSISKFKAERSVMETAANSDIDYVILRPPMVYGKGVSGNFLSLMKIAEKNIPVPFASIDNRRSIMYVENFANAVLLSIKHSGAKNQIFVIKDVSISVPTLFREIVEVMGKHPRMYPVPDSLLKLAGTLMFSRAVIDKLTDSLQINDSKIRNQLGWGPVIDFKESIKSTVHWYLETR